MGDSIENHRPGKQGSLSVAQHILPVSGKLLDMRGGLRTGFPGMILGSRTTF